MELAREAITALTRMRREVVEEERCFVHFGRWVRYGASSSPSLLYPLLFSSTMGGHA
jgi:hypothetical protein